MYLLRINILEIVYALRKGSYILGAVVGSRIFKRLKLSCEYPSSPS